MKRVGASGRALPAVFVIVAVVATALLVTSCPAPFSGDLLAHAQDTTAPVVTITTPENESYYAKSVAVTGEATDQTDNEGVAGLVVALRYEIPSASIVQSVDVGLDGSFSFSFSTTAFTGGNITVQVIATDLNGNEGSASISLLYGGSDIATFEAIPGNHEATLQWDPVPNVTGYTLRNLGEAAEVPLGPEESSYVWSDLENGSLYFFELEAADISGQTNTSSEVSVIPLSPYTLIPTVDSYADRAVISWRDMPGVDRYVVEKAEDIDGPYYKRFETIDTTVEDTQLVRDQFYYYRVYPQSQDEIRSAPVEAILVPFSVTGTELGNYYGPMNYAQFIVGYDDPDDGDGEYDYLYAYDRDTTTNESILRVLDASDPAHLTELNSLIVGSATWGDMVIDPDEHLIYIAPEEIGVQVIDISNPVNPVHATMGDGSDQWIGAPEDYGFYRIGMTRIGLTTYLFANTYSAYLYAGRVDRDGLDVTLVATISTPILDGDSSDRSEGLFVLGSTAYVSVKDDSEGEVGFVEVDLSTPESSLPTSTGYLMTGTDQPCAITANEDVVFMAYRTGASTYSMRAIDAITYSPLAQFDYNDKVQRMSIVDEILYVCAESDEILGYDVSSPPSADNPAPIIVPDMGGPAYQSVVVGDYLVVAGYVGIESFYLLPTIGYSSPQNVIGAYTNMYGFAAIGTNAHFLRLTSHYTADVTDPMTLSGLDYETNLGTGEYRTQLLLQGDREFVVGWDHIWILSAPSVAPLTEISSFTHNSSEFASIGDVSYGIKTTILSIFDTSDSESATQVRAIGSDVRLNAINARGHYLYVTYQEMTFSVQDTGIIVLDITDPIYPVEVNRVPAATNIGLHATAMFGDLIYCAYSDDAGTYQQGSDDESGLMVYSVADDPETPTLVGTYVGDDVFSIPEDYSKRFERVAVCGHLVVLSSGLSANATRYEGRAVLVNAADPTDMNRIKDIIPDGAYVPPADPMPDFPQRISFWRGAYLFVMGRNNLTVYEM
jgi:hypothetical protein